MTPIFLVLSLRQLEELAKAIREHRGPHAPDSACVVINGYALPPTDNDPQTSRLVSQCRYKVNGAAESHNLH